MATQYSQYKTLNGDRWDTIAYKAYGDASMFDKIVQANPSIAIVDVFESGIVLLVPLINISNSIPAILLPIWKQTTAISTQEATAAAPLFVQIAAAATQNQETLNLEDSNAFLLE